MDEIFKILADIPSRKEFVAAFKTAVKTFERAIADANRRIDARLATVQGKDGKDGRDGRDGAKGPKGDPGPAGRSIFGGRGEPGLDGRDGKDGSPDTPQQVRDKLETLSESERLDKKAIRGVEKIEEDIKALQLRPIGRGGGAKGIGLYVGGSKKLLTAQTINIVGGTGISISYAYASGRNDITISATGSVSLTPITMTGSVNDSNTSFTAASTPSLVMINGAAYRDGHGVTISGTSVTTDNPVGNGGDIYGL